MSPRICSTTNLRLIVSIFIGVFVAGFGNGLCAQEFVPEAQMIMFTPSDVEPPPEAEYQERLHQFAEYAEEFFHNGLTHWGYEPARKEIFNRDQDGKVSRVSSEVSRSAKPRFR